MGCMKCPGLVVIILSAALLSSCSWAKLRYQRIASHLRLPKTTKATNGPSLVRIQPTQAQIADAKKILQPSQPPAESATGSSSLEQAVAEQLMLSDEAAGGALPAGSTFTPTMAAPQEAAPFSAPQLALPTSSSSSVQLPPAASVLPYNNSKFVPRDAPYLLEPQGEGTATSPTEPTSATMRGLRSPALPQTLPMDIDGKLHSPSTL